MTIHIFTVAGHTFTFHGAKLIHDNETAIKFSYKAMSDGRAKVATFYKATLAGVSTAE